MSVYILHCAVDLFAVGAVGVGVSSTFASHVTVDDVPTAPTNANDATTDDDDPHRVLVLALATNLS